MAPESGKVAQRLCQREDLFTVVLEHFSDRHRRLRRLPVARHHAAGALGHPQQLRPHRRAAQPPQPLRRVGQARTNTDDLPASWPRAWGLTEPCFADDDRRPCAAQAFGAQCGLRGPAASTALRSLNGARGALCARAAFPRPAAAANFSASAWPTKAWTACPDHVPNRRGGGQLGALPAGHDLAACAQLSELQLL